MIMKKITNYYIITLHYIIIQNHKSDYNDCYKINDGKKEKEKLIKFDYIDKVEDRWFLCLFELGFSQSIYIPSFNFV